MKIYLSVNELRSAYNVWTIVRVEGDTYDYKEAIKQNGSFQFGFAFDDYLLAKEETGLEGKDLSTWLTNNLDRKKKRWALHYTGDIASNREKIETLSRAIGEACKHGDLEITETAPVILPEKEQTQESAPPSPAVDTNSNQTDEDDIPF